MGHSSICILHLAEEMSPLPHCCRNGKCWLKSFNVEGMRVLVTVK